MLLRDAAAFSSLRTLSHSHPTCHSILEGRQQLALEEAAGTDAEDC